MLTSKTPTIAEVSEVYAPKYDENQVLAKIKKSIRLVGRGMVWTIAALYVVAKSPKVPTGYKAMALGALAYFGIPVDAIPDVLPVIGYSDDIAVMSAAVGGIAHVLDAGLMANVNDKLIEWFPAEAAELAKDVTNIAK